MSNSSLISYTRISPNRTSPRNHIIDTITIHCVVGQCTVESLGATFANAERGASSNYGIGFDGKIAMYVEEKDRSWCTGGKDLKGNIIRVNGISGSDNDHRAVTIEVASETVEPYKVTDAAYKSLIKLVADICKRNNIKELKWQGDKSLVGNISKQNMTVHRWFANKSCPGDYLYNLHGQIAEEVNKIIAPKAPAKVKIESATGYDGTISGVYETTKKMRLRVGAGIDKKAIKIIPKGSTATCYGYHAKSKAGYKWMYVVCNGATGYLPAKYLKKYRRK